MHSFGQCCVEGQEKKTGNKKQIYLIQVNTFLPPSQQKVIIAGRYIVQVFVSLHPLSCCWCNEAEESHLTCWQQRRLVCELHLHSWKDNQPTGVFNLKYARWTINHLIQPLHNAQRHGRIFSPWQESTSPLSWTDMLPVQRECPPLIRSTQGFCTVMFCISTTTPRQMIELFSAGGYIWPLKRSWRIVHSSASAGVWTLAVSTSLPIQWWRLCGGRKCYPCGEGKKA